MNDIKTGVKFSGRRLADLGAQRAKQIGRFALKNGWNLRKEEALDERDEGNKLKKNIYIIQKGKRAGATNVTKAKRVGRELTRHPEHDNQHESLEEARWINMYLSDFKNHAKAAGHTITRHRGQDNSGNMYVAKDHAGNVHGQFSDFIQGGFYHGRDGRNKNIPKNKLKGSY